MSREACTSDDSSTVTLGCCLRNLQMAGATRWVGMPGEDNTRIFPDISWVCLCASSSAASTWHRISRTRSRYVWPAVVSASRRVVRRSSCTPRWSSRSWTMRVTCAGDNPSLRAPAAKPFSATTCLNTFIDCSLSMMILGCEDPCFASCQLSDGFDPRSARRERACRDRHALLHEPLGDRDGGGMRARSRIELAQDAVHVRLHGGDLDAEPPRDRLVGLARHHELQHVDLARCERRTGHAVRDALGDRAAQVAQAT